MATNDFLKGECRACGGHVEFPAAGTGQAINCPHCGQPTVLQPMVAGPTKAGRRLVLPGVIVVVILIVAAVVALRCFPREKPAPVVAVATNQVPALAPTNPTATPIPSVPAPTPEVMTLQPGETLTNDFIVTPVKLEPTPGSSLVYVMGQVRNETDRQRFGVKVRFTLLDATGSIIGHATDYQAVIEPRGEWGFKAMVMESKTVATRLEGISEDK